jgi:hypothetical protein
MELIREGGFKKAGFGGLFGRQITQPESGLANKISAFLWRSPWQYELVEYSTHRVW